MKAITPATKSMISDIHSKEHTRMRNRTDRMSVLHECWTPASGNTLRAGYPPIEHTRLSDLPHARSFA